MKKNEMLDKVQVKLVEMQDALTHLMDSDVAESTKRTQSFQRKTAIHNMRLLQAILAQCNVDEIKFTMEEDKWFTSMVTLTSDRKTRVSIEVKEGDKLMDLLNKYKDVKDVYRKIAEECEERGLKIVFDHIKRA